MAVENEECNLNLKLPDENSYTSLQYIQVLNIFFKVFDEIGITEG